MRNIISLVVIILIGLVPNLYPQQTFRRAVFLHGSVGNHIWSHVGASTNVPAEIDLYNTAHNYTGDEAVSMDEVVYPDLDGNTLWSWADIFDSTNVNYDIYTEYINDSTYDIIIIKECFTTSDIWFYWYEGPQDTVNYPVTHSIYNYQWYVRKILKKMELHPNKFFVFWNLPCTVTTYSTEADAGRLYWFNHWMTDTLAAGMDTSYGVFPDNVYIYDYFTIVDSSNFMPLSLADDPYDSHPNAAGSELVAPDFVEKTFNAAINYALPVELSAFSATIIGSSVQLEWRTETEVNNYGFEVERKITNWKKIGFMPGNGNSNSPKNYSFVDKNRTNEKYFYRLKQIDNDGQFEYSKVIEVDFNPITTYTLEQNYPNPFNPLTTIKYQVPEISFVNLKVYDVLGNEIETLVNEEKPTGIYEIEFDGTILSSGFYFYRFQSASFVETKKMILIK